MKIALLLLLLCAPAWAVDLINYDDETYSVRYIKDNSATITTIGPDQRKYDVCKVCVIAIHNEAGDVSDEIMAAFQERVTIHKGVLKKD